MFKRIYEKSQYEKNPLNIFLTIYHTRSNWNKNKKEKEKAGKHIAFTNKSESHAVFSLWNYCQL